MKYILNSIKVLAFLLVFSATAQQAPNFTLYKYNLNVINPAYAGSNGFSQLSANFRSQWVGVQDAPETQTLNYNGLLTEKVGMGVSVMRDNVFITNEYNVYADFSYRLAVADNMDLYLGLKAGGSFLDIDFTKLQSGSTDPMLNRDVSEFNPNVGAGLYLKGEKFFLSLSTPKILQSSRYDESTNSEATDELHVYLGGGYSFDVNDNVMITPSVMGRYVGGAPFSVDASLTARFMDKFEVGANYRLDDSVAGVAMFSVANWLDLGYAYEHTLSDVGDFNDGSHELLVRFNLRGSDSEEEMMTYEATEQ